MKRSDFKLLNSFSNIWKDTADLSACSSSLGADTVGYASLLMSCPMQASFIASDLSVFLWLSPDEPELRWIEYYNIGLGAVDEESRKVER